MKKTIAVLIVIMLIIVVVLIYQYNSYKTVALRNQKLNEEYEVFTQGEILGTSLITLINKQKSEDRNKKSEIGVLVGALTKRPKDKITFTTK